MGHGVHLLESESQRQIRERDEEIARLEAANATLIDAISGRKP